MNFIFCFLLPSIIGIKLIVEFNKEIDLKDTFLYYLLLVLLSNFICIGVIIILNNFDGNLIMYASEHLKFAFKYILLSIIINALLAFIFSILIKNLKIALEVQKESKKSVKKTKKNI